jgi:hypothetical protein
MIRFFSSLDGLLNPQVTERWSIEKIRSCSWLVGQSFTKEFDPFPSNLSHYSISKNENRSSKLSLEEQAHLKLQELGITPNSDNNRDDINGTYRIIFHRLQKQSNPLEHDDSYDKRMKEDFSSSWDRSISLNNETGERKTKHHPTDSHIQNTKVCTIL